MRTLSRLRRLRFRRGDPSVPEAGRDANDPTDVERSLHILVLADNFTPEIAATSFRIHEHARQWLREGHKVTVVTCAPNWPRGRVFDGYRNRLYQEEWIDGLRVVRVKTYIAANRGFARRSLDYLSFFVSVTMQCWRFPRCDVVLATSPQFFTALAGWTVSRLRRRPWVFELRDLWPASIAAVGAGGGRWLRWMERLELFLYRKADRILAVTEAFRDDLVARGIAHDKIDVVTNGVDLSRFDPRKTRERAEIRRRLGIPEKAFLAGYVGTLGMAHGLDTILDAADTTTDPSIHYLLLGEGARREELEQQLSERRLANVTCHPAVDPAEIPDILSALDVSLIHLKPDPVFLTVIPSKMFESMAMGVPIVLGVDGESAEWLYRCKSGLAVPPGNARAMAEAVQSLATDPERCRKLGWCGRQAVRLWFDRRRKAVEALEVIRLAAGQTERRSRRRAA